MPLVTHSDAGGATIRFIEIDGIPYVYIPSVDQEVSIRAVKEAKARDTDVIIVNYNKSGTHWLWEIISMIHNGSAETIRRIKQTSMFECLSLEQMEALPSPRIFNTHFRFSKLPADMLSKKVKIVLIHRNPKDVAVSLYNHHLNLTGLYDYNGEWKDYLSALFLPGKVDCGSWFEYVLDWEMVMKENPDYPIHHIFYEDLKENSEREIEKLVKFLDIPVTKELITSIGRKCQFENMVKDKAGLEEGSWKTMWRDEKPGYYRKGEVGDWKNWFTVAQNEMFDRVYRNKMADSQLSFRFEL